MCVEIRKQCECGSKEVQFHMRDNIMSSEVIDRLYCPSCSAKAEMDNETMLDDNGWIIEYDMDLARMYAISKLSMDPAGVNPEFIFDAGYVAWREMYPGETADIAGEREQIISTMKENPKRYLEEIKAWSINRINQLKEAGWRKAQNT